MQKQVAPATPKSLTDCLSAAFPGVTNYKAGDTQSATCRITLGPNVIVGANAVVTHSFQNNSVIAGCPAKLIKVLS